MRALNTTIDENFVEELKMAWYVGPNHARYRGVSTERNGICIPRNRPYRRLFAHWTPLRNNDAPPLQLCGHKPYLLIGGATGMIGDPSGKSQERNLLDAATLYHNQEAIKKQVSKFLDFDGDAPNKAELVNNYDWMKEFTLP